MVLYILGVGKYGKEIEDVAEQTNKCQTIQFLDDKLEKNLQTLKVLWERMQNSTLPLAIMN